MNQKRTCGIVSLVIMSLFSVIEAAAEDTNIEKGVSYLVEMQDPISKILMVCGPK